MTLDQLFESLEAERRNRPWYQKMIDSTYRWTWYKPRAAINDFFGNLVNRYQRSKYGIGYRDRWNFPAYFAGLVAHTATVEHEESYTYPGEERGFTEEQWHAEMSNIATVLREYREAYDATELFDGWYEDLTAKQERAEDAMKRFAALFVYVGD